MAGRSTLLTPETHRAIVAAIRALKWTGGADPLGYQVVGKKLVVDDIEAVVVPRGLLPLPRTAVRLGRCPDPWGAAPLDEEEPALDQGRRPQNPEEPDLRRLHALPRVAPPRRAHGDRRPGGLHSGPRPPGRNHEDRERHRKEPGLHPPGRSPLRLLRFRFHAGLDPERGDRVRGGPFA